MKKVILSAAAIAGVALLAGCGPAAPANNSAPANNNNQAPAAVPTPTSPTAPNVSQGNAVTIQNFAFSPATLTVKAGTTVTWTNSDSVTHSIKASTFNSPNLATGGKFQFTFSTPGTFTYSCGIHPSMQGTIIVQ